MLVFFNILYKKLSSFLIVSINYAFIGINLRITSNLHVYRRAIRLQVYRLSENHQVPVSVGLHSAICDSVSDVNGDFREIHRGLPSIES